MTRACSDIVDVASGDPCVIAVILFGSEARGELSRDTDVCLVTSPCTRRDVKLDYLSKFSSTYDIQIFHELPLYVRGRVVKEGIILLQKDRDALFTIFHDTIKDYTLFEPHFKHYLGMETDG